MSSRAFSAPEAWDILRAERPPAWVLGHVQAVHDLAVAMASRTKADVELVAAGAILHDLGRAQTQDTRHTVLGLQRARELQLPEAICRIIARHTGAGIDAPTAKALGWPAGHYTPETLEEKIVAHADNLHSGATRLTLAQVQQKYAAKKLPDAARNIAKLHKELSQLLGIDVDEIDTSHGN